MSNKPTQKQGDPRPNSDNDRCPTGVEGLDEILAGGLTRNCFYLVQGDPGAGKTTLALQFLLEGVRRGETPLYITLSETKEELVKVARSHGWSIEEIPLLELSAIERMLRPEAQTTVFHPSEMELDQVSRLVQGEAARVNPARVVFDSLSEFRLLAETALRYRRQLLTLKQHFARYNSTVLLLDDKMDNNRLGSDPHVLSVTHGVIEIQQFWPDYGTSRRRLRVHKFRGVQFREGFHDYTIVTGGLRIFPRLTAQPGIAKFRGESVASGISELDQLLGGGLDRGTTSLIIGEAGTGKSTLALQYAVRMAERGERGLLFTFDETRDVMIKRAGLLGLPLSTHVETGLLSLQQVDPAELSPGEFAVRIRQGVEAGCKVVVIDSLNGYLNAMPGEKFLNNQLHELSSYLSQQGVLTILILAQHGLLGMARAPVDLSYLSDTVISLRFFEVGGEVRQAISVIKKRSGHHEKTIREFRLDPGNGIRIGHVLKEFEGILNGSPIFRGREAQMLKTA